MTTRQDCWRTAGVLALAVTAFALAACGRRGLPLLARIPVLGGLFGNQELKNNRTELVLFITPRVVENEADYRRVIDDLRRKMEQIDDLFPAPKTAPQGPGKP